MKNEYKLIIKRKAVRINKANSMITAVSYDIKETAMSKEDRDWLLTQLETIRNVLQNDDKETNVYNS